MKFERLPLPELVSIVPARLGDTRGFFSEVFKEGWFRENVADVGFVQENESLSAKIGTVRGLHFQLAPFAQGKLVRCIAGRIFDVAVDIRRGSPTYGRWYGLELSMENAAQLWIPPGFAHGFATLDADSIVSYKVTAPYSEEHDRGVLWNDDTIGISWPIDLNHSVVSEKDTRQPSLANLPDAFNYF